MRSGFKDLDSVKTYVCALAHLYEIPPPRVDAVDDNPKYHAYFDVEEWVIAVSLPVSVKHVRHEFLHYCIALIKRAESLEEDLARVYGEIEEDGLER